MQLPLLSLLILIPLIAGVICLFVKAEGARWAALIATLIDFALSIYLWTAYDPGGAQWQFVERMAIGGGINWALGIDGIALVLIVLTTFLSRSASAPAGARSTSACPNIWPISC